MAQRLQIHYVDDLDGSDAEETVTFTVDGVSYEIDLSEQNAQSLRDSLKLYIDKARRVGGRKATSGKSSRAASSPSDESKTIREWAQKNGYQVSGRGRISAEIREAYAKAS